MFLYLFLTAALIASSETPTTNTTAQEQQELQEIIALFAQCDNATDSVTEIATTSTTENIVASTVPIKITNAIEPSMLAYKHWTGTYSPETFTVKVNGTEVAQGACYELKETDSSVDISYAYSFMSGMRTGTKTVTYKLNENSTQANITFSWKDSWKVLVDNGVAVKEVTT
jgi:hypothetical protein